MRSEILVRHRKMVIFEVLELNFSAKNLKNYQISAVGPAFLNALYEESELTVFDNIECEWPVFYVVLFLQEVFDRKIDDGSSFEKNEYGYGEYDNNGCYIHENNRDSRSIDYLQVLSGLEDSEGLLPVHYAVENGSITEEREFPNSTIRTARYPNKTGSNTHYWTQSLYYISLLLENNHITCNDLDPLDRHSSILPFKEIKISTIVEIVLFTDFEEVAEMDFPGTNLTILSREQLEDKYRTFGNFFMSDRA